MSDHEEDAAESDDETRRPQKRQKTSELQRYSVLSSIKANECPLQWWAVHEKEYPKLALMARICLAMQVTSASSERSFSDARMNLSYLRMRLRDDTLAFLMWLKCNESTIVDLGVDWRTRLKSSQQVVDQFETLPESRQAALVDNLLNEYQSRPKAQVNNNTNEFEVVD